MLKDSASLFRSMYSSNAIRIISASSVPKSEANLLTRLFRSAEHRARTTLPLDSSLIT